MGGGVAGRRRVIGESRRITCWACGVPRRSFSPCYSLAVVELRPEGYSAAVTRSIANRSTTMSSTPPKNPEENLGGMTIIVLFLRAAPCHLNLV